MKLPSLIPTNGVYVTETYGPPGFYVARYDGEGFVADQRWFPTQDKAYAYAATLRAQS